MWKEKENKFFLASFPKLRTKQKKRNIMNFHSFSFLCPSSKQNLKVWNGNWVTQYYVRICVFLCDLKLFIFYFPLTYQLLKEKKEKNGHVNDYVLHISRGYLKEIQMATLLIGMEKIRADKNACPFKK